MFIYTEWKQFFALIFVAAQLYIKWILFEPMWKRCRFRCNISEPLCWMHNKHSVYVNLSRILQIALRLKKYRVATAEKTENLEFHFARQGKQREFPKNI